MKRLALLLPLLVLAAILVLLGCVLVQSCGLFDRKQRYAPIPESVIIIDWDDLTVTETILRPDGIKESRTLDTRDWTSDEKGIIVKWVGSMRQPPAPCRSENVESPSYMLATSSMYATITKHSVFLSRENWFTNYLSRASTPQDQAVFEMLQSKFAKEPHATPATHAESAEPAAPAPHAESAEGAE